MLTAHHTIRSGGVFTFFGNLIAGAAFAVAVLALSTAPVMAQKKQQQQQAAQPEEEELDQIELTPNQIDAFITAQTAIKPITAKLKGNAQPSKQMMAQMEDVVKKAGFKDFDEFGDVGANIGFVFGGIDPATKKFSEPEVQIKQEIDKVTADSKIPAAKKKQILQQLAQAQKSAPKLKYPANVDLVAKNYDRLKPVME
jgi:hypothetical protein